MHCYWFIGLILFDRLNSAHRGSESDVLNFENLEDYQENEQMDYDDIYQY